MQRHSLAAGLAFIALLFCTSITAHAQIEAFGMGTANFFSIDWDEASQNTSAQSFPYIGGFGALGGVRYWITESIGLGAAVDYLTGTGEFRWEESRATHRFETSSTGLDGALSLRVPVGNTVELAGFALVGSYGASHADTLVIVAPDGAPGAIVEESRVDLDRTVGYVLGAQVGYEFLSGLHISAVVGYRSLPFGAGTESFSGAWYIDDELYDSYNPEDVRFDQSFIDLSGLMGGLGVSYTF